MLNFFCLGRETSKGHGLKLAILIDIYWFGVEGCWVGEVEKTSPTPPVLLVPFCCDFESVLKGSVLFIVSLECLDRLI